MYKACEAIIAMCVMHNFLLAAQDSWELTQKDMDLVAKLDEEFYNNMIHSHWAAIGARGQGNQVGGGSLSAGQESGENDTLKGHEKWGMSYSSFSSSFKASVRT